MNKEPYIVTFTGKRICPVSPDIDEICIEDIAHSLALKCRFGGHTRVFFSVAQHSVIVSNFCSDPLHGLLHDAGEAYLADVASTVKHLFPTMRYAEEILVEKIFKKFGVMETEKTKRCTHSVDRAMLRVEWDALINDPNGYGLGVDMSSVPELKFKLNGFWCPVEAERVFLKRFHDLYHPVCKTCNGTEQIGKEQFYFGRSVGWKNCPDCNNDE